MVVDESGCGVEEQKMRKIGNDAGIWSVDYVQAMAIAMAMTTTTATDGDAGGERASSRARRGESAKRKQKHGSLL